MASDEYTHGRDGKRVYAGDYVKCVGGNYMGLPHGQNRRVISVSNDTLIMRNEHSPTGTSAYQPNNFELAGRHHAWHKSQEAQMGKAALYVAMRIGDNPYENVAKDINNGGLWATDHSDSVHADTSFESLKAWLNQRIRANPDERWLVLSGTTLAETSAPPVTFRSV